MLTPDQHAEVVRRYAAGESSDALCLEYGLKKGTLYAITSRAGLKRRLRLASIEEKRQRKNERTRAYYRKNYQPYDSPVLVVDVVAPRPPLAVLLEYDFRCEQLAERSFEAAIQGDPPLLYSADYYRTAYRLQARFARTR